MEKTFPSLLLSDSLKSLRTIGEEERGRVPITRERERKTQVRDKARPERERERERRRTQESE